MRNLVNIAAGAVLGSVIAEKSAGKGLLGAGMGALATRLATRSIPGALLVGGAIAAKTIYDKRKERRIGDSKPKQIAKPSDPDV
ncbi:MAG: hypothetical protein IBJ12_02250 [Sphingomonadaceae bacterium]|nr:hypothetical protein [Sphingomonadaceae bacterium]